MLFILQNDTDLSPFDKSLFLFGNKRRNMLKVLYLDRNDFCLWQKIKNLFKIEKTVKKNEPIYLLHYTYSQK
ncbi:MAG: IS66 family insertion sequence element accessory protein TnpB [Leptospiraceae bacterium]|nr:IS66 family insertion sequence element accessory protein TnpB [Leptospiraceae bacterium]